MLATLGISVFMIVAVLCGASLLSILVGLVGARRKIGFGLTFLLSVIFTPVVGLIATLLSDELPQGERRWGCGVIVFAMLFWVLLFGALFFAAYQMGVY